MEIKCATPGISGLQNGLITSTGLNSKKEAVYSKHFQHPSFTLLLRPFNIPCNRPVIYNRVWKFSRSANIIRLFKNVNKKVVRPLHLKALQTCVEYFFLFPEIKQIICTMQPVSLYTTKFYTSIMTINLVLTNQTKRIK
jgi:hypothetical protein